MKLHLGCGQILLPGWLNVDAEPGHVSGPVDRLKHDLTTPLPVPTGTVDLVFSEHFIEHITMEQGAAFLRECFRVLRRGGKIRVSTPNLFRLAQDYVNGKIDRWNDSGWEPKTPAQLLNEGMRLWGHQFLYDAKEMHRALGLAGFRDVEFVLWRKSTTPELQDLEARPDYQDLIVEATKP